MKQVSFYNMYYLPFARIFCSYLLTSSCFLGNLAIFLNEIWKSANSWRYNNDAFSTELKGSVSTHRLLTVLSLAFLLTSYLDDCLCSLAPSCQLNLRRQTISGTTLSQMGLLTTTSRLSTLNGTAKLEFLPLVA